MPILFSSVFMKKNRRKSKEKPNRRRGLFLTFEGIEGSGKSTQCHSLAGWLRTRGYQVLETREPGGTRLAEKLRDCLLARLGEPVTPWTEALIVLAARSQHVELVIRPALELGAIVLCDRFLDSTLAYQGFGRGIDLTLLTRMSKTVAGKVAPDLTLWFDVPVEVGLRRRHHGQLSINRIDAESMQFHERVRRGFRTLARRYPRRIHAIDADRLPDLISTDVERLVETYLTTRVLRKSHD